MNVGTGSAYATAGERSRWRMLLVPRIGGGQDGCPKFARISLGGGSAPRPCIRPWSVAVHLTFCLHVYLALVTVKLLHEGCQYLPWERLGGVSDATADRRLAR